MRAYLSIILVPYSRQKGCEFLYLQQYLIVANVELLNVTSRCFFARTKGWFHFQRGLEGLDSIKGRTEKKGACQKHERPNKRKVLRWLFKKDKSASVQPGLTIEY